MGAVLHARRPVIGGRRWDPGERCCSCWASRSWQGAAARRGPNGRRDRARGPVRQRGPVGRDAAAGRGGQPASPAETSRGVPGPAGRRRGHRETNPGRAPRRGHPSGRRRRIGRGGRPERRHRSTRHPAHRERAGGPARERHGAGNILRRRSSSGSRWGSRVGSAASGSTPPGSGRLVVAILDTDPAAATLARCLEPGQDVAYVAATRSLADTNALNARISADMGELRSGGVQIQEHRDRRARLDHGGGRRRDRPHSRDPRRAGRPVRRHRPCVPRTLAMTTSSPWPRPSVRSWFRVTCTSRRWRAACRFGPPRSTSRSWVGDSRGSGLSGQALSPRPTGEPLAPLQSRSGASSCIAPPL